MQSRLSFPKCDHSEAKCEHKRTETQAQSVSQLDKLLAKILSGTSDSSIPFAQICQLLRRLGFEERIRGSHHIFSKEGVEEILNLQPKGSQAKAYQVKQVRTVILKYQLGGEDDASL
jgi:hypothetical protein